MRLALMPKNGTLQAMRLFHILTFASLTIWADPCFSQQMVSVAIASGPKITVVGNAIKLYDDGEKEVFSASNLKIALKGKRLTVNGKALNPPLRLLSDSPMTVGEKMVRGELDVVVDASEMTIVHPIFLEDYVAGIVASEMPKSWPLEALKAQAIAARTYALFQKYRRIDKAFHLDSTVLDQVYGGLEKDHDRAAQAAKATEGLVLTYEAKIVKAYFYSSCGGETASAQEVWGADLPYLPGGSCGFCTKEANTEWKYRISKKAFEKAISGYKTKGLVDVKLGSHSDSGRVQSLEIDFNKKKTLEIPASDLRQRLGYGNLKSTVLERVETNGKDITFYGRGFGHGVGMCQWGTNRMAKEGFLASDILARYYPGSELRRIY